MAKRRINKQQKRRIDGRRQREHSSDQAPEQEGELGPEQSGIVVARYGRQADVLGDEGEARCHLRQHLGDLVTGDTVIWRDGPQGAVVVAVEPRKSIIHRRVNYGDPRPVAANIDLLLVVIAPEPEFHRNLIDRYLVAAHHAEIEAALILNKCEKDDGAGEQALRDYGALGYQTLACSVHTSQGMQDLAQLMATRTSALVGQSGVGKSSLLNVLVPTADMAVGELSEATSKGRHTTTTSRLHLLPGGGLVIDSPGIREFGLCISDWREIAQGFVEFLPLLGLCRYRDCSHRGDPACALLEAVENGTIDRKRFESYLHISGEEGAEEAAVASRRD